MSTATKLIDTIGVDDGKKLSAASRLKSVSEKAGVMVKVRRELQTIEVNKPNQIRQ